MKKNKILNTIDSAIIAHLGWVDKAKVLVYCSTLEIPK